MSAEADGSSTACCSSAMIMVTMIELNKAKSRLGQLNGVDLNNHLLGRWS